MKNYYSLLLTVFTVSTAIFLISGVDYSSGSPGGRTGSPGDGGSTCTQCHAGTAEPADGFISSNIPVEGFVPGVTYEVQVAVSGENAGLYGFEVTAENDVDGKTGTFSITDEEATQFVNNNAAVSHTSAGTTPVGDAKTWTMEWTAPEEPEGPVTFYTAVNAANGDGTNNGDQIFTSSQTYQINSVGISESKIVQKLYPNPATDNLHVVADAAGKEVRIWNASGKQVASEQINGRENILDVSDYPEGIYFLSIEGFRSTKFVVKR